MIKSSSVFLDYCCCPRCGERGELAMRYVNVGGVWKPHMLIVYHGKLGSSGKPFGHTLSRYKYPDLYRKYGFAAMGHNYHFKLKTRAKFFIRKVLRIAFPPLLWVMR